MVENGVSTTRHILWKPGTASGRTAHWHKPGQSKSWAPAPCGPPVNDVSSQAAGTAPLCDMTAQPRGTDSRATVSAPHSCIAVRRAMLYKFVEGYTAKNTAKNRCIALYTDTRCVTALHSYTALYTIQLYSYTALYTLQPLQHPSDYQRGVLACGCSSHSSASSLLSPLFVRRAPRVGGRERSPTNDCPAEHQRPAGRAGVRGVETTAVQK